MSLHVPARDSLRRLWAPLWFHHCVWGVPVFAGVLTALLFASVELVQLSAGTQVVAGLLISQPSPQPTVFVGRSS